jgi:hypothetical protein
VTAGLSSGTTVVRRLSEVGLNGTALISAEKRIVPIFTDCPPSSSRATLFHPAEAAMQEACG